MKWITKKRNEDDVPGVYLLLDKDLEVLYVGQSETIRHRIKSHYNIPWVYYKYTKVEDMIERANLEHELLIKYRPLYNKIYSKVVLPNTTQTPEHRKYTGINRFKRWEKEAAIISQYGLLSSRKMQKLLFIRYGISVNHVTILNDLKHKKYTPYLEKC